MEPILDLMIMSGVADGSQYRFDSVKNNGTVFEDGWTLSIGRHDDNDLCLHNDTFVSRNHAFLHWRDNGWWLEDHNSTNGTFVENPDDFFNDRRVTGTIPIDSGQLFRVGRTWLRIQTTVETQTHDQNSP